MMLRDKPVSHLLLILFVSAIGGNVVGESLRLILRLIAEDTIVEKALLNYMSYTVGPHMLNLIILSFQFAFTLNFNVITLLGIFVGWYYFKYSY
jgi:hypothetical protein